jgi:hypothetical protein
MDIDEMEKAARAGLCGHCRMGLPLEAPHHHSGGFLYWCSVPPEVLALVDAWRGAMPRDKAHDLERYTFAGRTAPELVTLTESLARELAEARDARAAAEARATAAEAERDRVRGWYEEAARVVGIATVERDRLRAAIEAYRDLIAGGADIYTAYDVLAKALQEGDHE